MVGAAGGQEATAATAPTAGFRDTLGIFAPRLLKVLPGNPCGSREDLLRHTENANVSALSVTMHTRACTHMQYTHMHTHSTTHSCTYTSTHTLMHIHTHICIHTLTCTHATPTSTYTHVCTHNCMHILMQTQRAHAQAHNCTHTR